jgi:hypothetical protein
MLLSRVLNGNSPRTQLLRADNDAFASAAKL